jgi:hypothetical protein
LQRPTNTLIHRVHTHILVELRRRIFLAWRSFCPSPRFQLLHILHALTQFRRAKISKRKTDDNHSSSKIVCEIESFRQFRTNDRELSEKSVEHTKIMGARTYQ